MPVAEPDEVELVQARNPAQVAAIRALFEEYAAAIGVDLEYQNFSAELAALPAPYEPPDGALLLALANGVPAGCAALRRLDGRRSGEMKRLYVRPAQRGGGLAQRLIETVVQAARAAGYAELRLDTLADMRAAQALYRKLGFVEIAPYGSKHLPGTRFYGLALPMR